MRSSRRDTRWFPFLLAFFCFPALELLGQDTQKNQGLEIARLNREVQELRSRLDQVVGAEQVESVPPGSEGTSGPELPAVATKEPTGRDLNRRTWQEENNSSESLTNQTVFQNKQNQSQVGIDFFRSDSDFSRGLVVRGDNVAMKIGGYVKLDLIHDFNAIDSTDLFNVLSIPTNAADRTNSRFHARQTRLNFDTRWQTENLGEVRAFVEGDFFSDDDQFRLRQAYGEVGGFLGGQTFTTFANLDAAPATLDFEGSISAITLRRTQVRWEFPVSGPNVTLAMALEDSSTAIELPATSTIKGKPRTVSPDLVMRLRRTTDNGNQQFAGIIRELGFQPTGSPVLTELAWGLNYSQFQELSPNYKFYWQINHGQGIASLLGGLPDVTPVGTDSAAFLGYFGWMVGSTREWNEQFSTNLTFAESRLSNTSGQLPSEVNNLTYLAANVIWTPAERFSVGLEYLYGRRINIDGSGGLANRLQLAVFYYLP